MRKLNLHRLTIGLNDRVYQHMEEKRIMEGTTLATIARRLLNAAVLVEQAEEEIDAKAKAERRARQAADRRRTKPAGQMSLDCSSP